MTKYYYVSGVYSHKKDGKEVNSEFNRVVEIHYGQFCYATFYNEFKQAEKDDVKFVSIRFKERISRKQSDALTIYFSSKR